MHCQSPIASSKQNELLSAINEIKARCLINFVLVQDILLFAHKKVNFQTLFIITGNARLDQDNRWAIKQGVYNSFHNKRAIRFLSLTAGFVKSLVENTPFMKLREHTLMLWEV